MTDVFQKLRDSILTLEAAIGASGDVEHQVSARILRERTERIAREPVRVERALEALTCMAFQRCTGTQYRCKRSATLDSSTRSPTFRASRTCS